MTSEDYKISDVIWKVQNIFLSEVNLNISTKVTLKFMG